MREVRKVAEKAAKQACALVSNTEASHPHIDLRPQPPFVHDLVWRATKNALHAGKAKEQLKASAAGSESSTSSSSDDSSSEEDEEHPKPWPLAHNAVLKTTDSALLSLLARELIWFCCC